MEVLASVAIISIVGMALLQVAANNSQLIIHILNKTIHDSVSHLAEHIRETDNRREREPYEVIRQKYEIKTTMSGNPSKSANSPLLRREEKYELFKEFQLQTDEEPPPLILNIGRYRTSNEC